MKKFFALALALVLCLSLTACGGSASKTIKVGATPAPHAEILEVANSAGEARCADEAKQADLEAELHAKRCNAQADEVQKRREEKMVAQWRMKRLLKMIARVAACLVAAAVFLAVMLDPRWVPVVGCVGIMVFVVMGAIILDRHIKGR